MEISASEVAIRRAEYMLTEMEEGLISTPENRQEVSSMVHRTWEIVDPSSRRAIIYYLCRFLKMGNCVQK